MHVRKGDQVQVLSGNYKGVRGTVLRTIPRKNKVVVEGVNIRKRHEAPSQANPEGGIVTFAAPIDASNVMLVDPTNDEPSRYRNRIDDDGTKERISVKSGNPIPKA
ncbi:MAG: 50S ribosomal protein L24 [Acidobacteriota bacterium]|nr:50S ribosomal protein L24 [Acidobacteriota bacterium]